MSYILEALRKADAERERGSVPDLQSQLLPQSPADDEPAPRRAAGWRWLALAVIVLLLGLAAGWFFARAPQPEVGPVIAPAAVPVASSPASVPSAVAAAPAPVPPSAAAAAAPTPSSAAPPTPKAAKAAPAERAQTTRARKESASAKPPPAASARPKPEPKAAPKADAAPSPAAPSEPAGLVLRQNELPEDLRRQVPVLTVGGSVYSPQADKRMVILNGQVFAEGAMLTPELKLEQIRPKSAVLSIRGQRFELPL